MKGLSLRKLSKDEITQSALAELKLKGCRVRKVHNVSAYKKRKGQVEKGWCDIQGYDNKGLHLECEVKTIGDKFSAEQIERLEDLDKCGGVSLVATQVGTQVKILSWSEAKSIFRILET